MSENSSIETWRQTKVAIMGVKDGENSADFVIKMKPKDNILAEYYLGGTEESKHGWISG